MSKSDLDRLRALVTEWDQEYDPDVRLIRKPFRSPGYHTTLKGAEFTHPTRESVAYALALLDTELVGNVERAHEVIGQVLSLQDRDRTRPTYGIWPWFYEEPLERMSPPDWNWADFCGKQLVLIVCRHLRRLPAVLAEQVRQAVFAACDAIMKRNVGPEYTNIAIMGAFVTLIAGERYDHESFRAYGLQRLRTFRDFTRNLGTFQEFNSPTYSPIAITELSCVLSNARTPEAAAMAEELLDIAWEMAALHFHPGTKQWGGPHSRTYRTLLGPETLSFLDEALGGGSGLIDAERKRYSFDYYRTGIHCPERFRPLFTGERRGSELRQPITAGSAAGKRVWATTAADEVGTLGTFDREVMWNQRRNWLAYVRTERGPVCIALRFLHDGYDYSSAVFTSAQQAFDTLFTVTFCTDGGDTHIGLDRIDGAIEAEDLRLRFEIGGAADGVIASASGDRAEAVLGGDVRLDVALLHAAFEGEAPRWETGSGEGSEGAFRYIDYVLYTGKRKRIDFRQLTEATLIFASRLGRGWTEADRLATKVSDGTASAQFDTADARLAVTVSLRPDAKSALLGNHEASVTAIETEGIP